MVIWANYFGKNPNPECKVVGKVTRNGVLWGSGNAFGNGNTTF